MIKGQVIKQFYCKAKNRRVYIELHYFSEEPKPYLFRIRIKTYKGGRNINLTENYYYPETFVLIAKLMNDFVDTQLLAVVYPERLKGDISEFNEIKKHIDEQF